MKRSVVGCLLVVGVVAAGTASMFARSAVRLREPSVEETASRGAAIMQVDPERLPDGIRLQTKDGFLTVQAKTDSIVRVTFARTRDFRANNMVVVGPGDTGAAAALNPFRSGPPAVRAPPAPRWTLRSTAGAVTLSTAKLRVTVNRADGAVTFADTTGRTILAETPGGHRMTPATVQGEQTCHVQQLWRANADESLYGLGQRQEGKLNIKGYDFDLWQRNMVVHVPVVVSSRGYGLLWDNTAPSKFGDVGPFEPIPADNLIDISGQAPPIRGWQGQIVAPVTGEYQFQVYSNGTTRVWLAGALQIDHYKQNWATEYDQFKVHLEAGKRYPIKITNSAGNTLRLLWKTPPPTPDTSMWSEVGEGIDYYFIHGPEIDQVIAGYRDLTGRASMLPEWAFGLWQSKNKYNTQDER